MMNDSEDRKRCSRFREGKVFKSGSPEELAADEQVRKKYLGDNFELR